VVATLRALEALTETGQKSLELLTRHVSGDWAEVPDEDKAE
jgi:hypothetical protein